MWNNKCDVCGTPKDGKSSGIWHLIHMPNETFDEAGRLHIQQSNNTTLCNTCYQILEILEGIDVTF